MLPAEMTEADMAALEDPETDLEADHPLQEALQSQEAAFMLMHPETV